MGKVLKTAITKLLDSMGEYCFPNGRPTLSFEGPKCDVTQNLTDVDSDFSALRVDEGGSLEITLTPSDNLHVFLTGDVTVTMGGDNITSTAWNESTGKVTIAEVTDDVVITAKSSTYIQDGLVAMWDGKNVDSANNQWIDVVGNKALTLTGCTVASDNVDFDGSDDKAQNTDASVYVDAEPLLGTIESVTVQQALAENSLSFIFAQPRIQGKALMMLSLKGFKHNTRNYTNISINQSAESSGSSVTDPNSWYFQNGPTTLFLSLSNARAYLNGSASSMLRDTAPWNSLTHQYARLSISSIISSSNVQLYSKMKMYCLRVYSTQLSDADVLHNYAIDRKRFNLSIS